MGLFATPPVIMAISSSASAISSSSSSSSSSGLEANKCKLDKQPRMACLFCCKNKSSKENVAKTGKPSIRLTPSKKSLTFDLACEM